MSGLQKNRGSVPCGGHDVAEMDEKTAERLGLSFPQVHLQREAMVRFAEAVKKEQGNQFCVLPFCHTIEGEALGGNVNYGDIRFGPRAGKSVCRRAEEVLNLSSIDFSTGRIREALDACAELTQMGEAVIFNMSGPLTILNVLMETEDVFRLLMDMKRDFEKDVETNAEQEISPARAVFQKLKGELLRCAEKIAEAGAVGISYADPLCGADIIGPQLNALLGEQFTLPFLREVNALLKRAAFMYGETERQAAPFFFLCPRLLPENVCKELSIRDAQKLLTVQDGNAVLSFKKDNKSVLVGGCCIKSLICGERGEMTEH